MICKLIYILIIIIILLILFYAYTASKNKNKIKHVTPEHFINLNRAVNSVNPVNPVNPKSMKSTNPVNSTCVGCDKLNPEYSTPISESINNIAFDKMKCDKNCCGNMELVSFDGLTPSEIKQVMSMHMERGPFIRTNYTGIGSDGVGCPCVTKEAHHALVSRGGNRPVAASCRINIDPSLTVG